MKWTGKLFSIIAVLLILLMGLSANKVKSGQGISLELPDGYVHLTSKNAGDYPDLLERLGYTERTFLELFDSGTVLFAAGEDATHQVSVKVMENDLSQAIGDLTLLNADEQKSVLQSLVDSLEKSTDMTLLQTGEATQNDTLFYYVEVKVAGSQDYCYREYFSIWDGKFVALTFYNNTETFSDEDSQTAEQLFFSLSFKRTVGNSSAGGFTLQIVITTAVIIIIGIVAVIIILSFVRDFRRKRNSTQETIKRRR